MIGTAFEGALRLAAGARAPRRIAIVGAGFYGCHIAATLMALGLEVTLFERSEGLMTQASGANQFRLHLGFHYARCHATRMQSRDGFRRFVQHYPGMTAAVEENIYAVSRSESLVDYETYKMIMTGSAIPFEEIESASIPITGVSGMMLAGERVLLIDAARRHFDALVGDRVRFGRAVGKIDEHEDRVEIDGERFDYAIDCTWGHLTRPAVPVFYEPTLMLYYETNGAFPAVTMVDGPLYSVYPTQDPSIFTLSSVTETPLGQFDNPAAALVHRDSLTGADIAAKQRAMEQQIHKYLPDFGERFRYAGPQLSLKTKLTGLSDSRTCSVSGEGRVLSVVSGKIDAVFFAMERVLELIGAPHPRAMAAVRSLPGQDRSLIAGFR